ncbi:MAG: hypothetical protein P8M20_02310 [Planctomycetaceae bacterium]|nr:hypothetical protein [Planctomycetaceae bacterium]
MTRPLYIVIVTSLAVASVLAGCFRDVNSDQDKPIVRVDTPPSEEAESTIPADKDSSSAKLQLTEADLARTSWENPFRPRLWSSENWRIAENSMICDSDSGQPATFFRPYRSVVIECRFSRTKENESETATEEHMPIECEIRLINRNSNRWVSLSLRPTHITLAESADGANSTMRTLRETDRSSGDSISEVVVRLTLTPNRLLVTVDGQLKINATRPGSIMMVDCLAQFVVLKRNIVLSDVRFEGD